MRNATKQCEDCLYVYTSVELRLVPIFGSEGRREREREREREWEWEREIEKERERERERESKRKAICQHRLLIPSHMEGFEKGIDVWNDFITLGDSEFGVHQLTKKFLDASRPISPPCQVERWKTEPWSRNLLSHALTYNFVRPMAEISFQLR